MEKKNNNAGEMNGDTKRFAGQAAEVFTICGLPVRIERRRVKYIYLHLKAPYQELLVTAAPGVAQRRIMEFARSKEAWVERSLARLRPADGSPVPERSMSRPMPAQTRRTYAAALEAVIPGMIQTWEKRMGVRADGGWNLRVMRRCWGVCHTRRHSITFNVWLAQKPDECIEYVVVHELCHLLEPSHNARFHALMTRFLPDWKERKKRLNQEAGD